MHIQFPVLSPADPNAETPSNPTSDPAHRQLFIDNDTLAHIHSLALAKEEGNKKVTLPDIIPGFKASPLGIGKNPDTFVLRKHLLSSTAGDLSGAIGPFVVPRHLFVAISFVVPSTRPPGHLSFAHLPPPPPS